MHPIDVVVPLRAFLTGLLRHAVGRTVGHAGKIELRSGRDGVSGVDEIVEAVAGAIEQRRADDARPRGLEGLEVVVQVLALGSRADRLAGKEAGSSGGAQAL